MNNNINSQTITISVLIGVLAIIAGILVLRTWQPTANSSQTTMITSEQTDTIQTVRIVACEENMPLCMLDDNDIFDLIQEACTIVENVDPRGTMTNQQILDEIAFTVASNEIRTGETISNDTLLLATAATQYRTILCVT